MAGVWAGAAADRRKGVKGAGAACVEAVIRMPIPFRPLTGRPPIRAG